MTISSTPCPLDLPMRSVKIFFNVTTPANAKAPASQTALQRELSYRIQVIPLYWEIKGLFLLRTRH
ncbi:hypothetical protein LEMLEM_LOCUS23254 [Lemmus lemmus]